LRYRGAEPIDLDCEVAYTCGYMYGHSCRRGYAGCAAYHVYIMGCSAVWSRPAFCITSDLFTYTAYFGDEGNLRHWGQVRRTEWTMESLAHENSGKNVHHGSGNQNINEGDGKYFIQGMRSNNQYSQTFSGMQFD